MQAFECPSCLKRTISFWRRQFLAPVLWTRCPHCKARVTIPGSGLWTTFPLIFAFVLTLFIDSDSIDWIVLIGGFALSVWLNNQFVSLVQKA